MIISISKNFSFILKFQHNFSLTVFVWLLLQILQHMFSQLAGYNQG